jgi:DNA-directed RNA polymerase subunit omega
LKIMDISASSDSIKANVPNRYSLVVLAAKRAKMIREGSPVLINTTSTNWLTIALEEIAAGKINYIDAPEVPDDEVPHSAAREAKLAANARQSAAMRMLDESLTSPDLPRQRETGDEVDEAESTDEMFEDAMDNDSGEPAEELETAAISED